MVLASIILRTFKVANALRLVRKRKGCFVDMPDPGPTPTGPDIDVFDREKAPSQRGTEGSNLASSSGESPANLLHAPKRAVSKQWLLNGGPMVRILVPPAVSQQRTASGDQTLRRGASAWCASSAGVQHTAYRALPSPASRNLAFL